MSRAVRRPRMPTLQDARMEEGRGTAQRGTRPMEKRSSIALWIRIHEGTAGEKGRTTRPETLPTKVAADCRRNPRTWVLSQNPKRGNKPASRLLRTPRSSSVMSSLLSTGGGRPRDPDTRRFCAGSVTVVLAPESPSHGLPNFRVRLAHSAIAPMTPRYLL